MNVILSGLSGNKCLAYLDDAIIFSEEDVDEHLARLEEVFERMRMNNLTFKPTKCRFLQKEAKFLGHVISAQGVATDPEKTSVIRNYPELKNVRDVRAFLGLCGFYRKFIPKFSETAEPLSRLIKKNQPLVWKKEQEDAFEKLKTLLCSPPILKYPDFSIQILDRLLLLQTLRT